MNYICCEALYMRLFLFLLIIFISIYIFKHKHSKYRSSYNHSTEYRPPIFSFQDGISEDEFRDIVLSVTKHIANKRIHDVCINSSIIQAYVRSQSGISDWKFELDFDDYGHLTGKYRVLYKENKDSKIPEACGNQIAQKIKEKRNNSL